MDSKSTKLLEPLIIGPLTLRNRVIMSALTRSRSVPTNVPNDLNLEYYVQRARGGAGLITTEGMLICQQGCLVRMITSVQANHPIPQDRMAECTWNMESGPNHCLEKDN
jgi:2,4-dienoyl-CoA reductase-like NADH-dependent reductase (Old Yellow Enzyme family)